jgi:hypothetical protein
VGLAETGDSDGVPSTVDVVRRVGPSDEAVAVVLARATADPELAQEMLDSVRAGILEPV